MRLHFYLELFVLLDISEARLNNYTDEEVFLIIAIHISRYFMLDYWVVY